MRAPLAPALALALALVAPAVDAKSTVPLAFGTATTFVGAGLLCDPQAEATRFNESEKGAFCVIWTPPSPPENVRANLTVTVAPPKEIVVGEESSTVDISGSRADPRLVGILFEVDANVFGTFDVPGTLRVDRPGHAPETTAASWRVEVPAPVRVDTPLPALGAAGALLLVALLRRPVR